MNYYDARLIAERWASGADVDKDVLEAAMTFLDTHQVSRGAVRVFPPLKRMPAIAQRFDPTMDTLCVCGMRYGQHRVNDYACQNPEWRPGNGQPQWLKAVFRRAA